MTDDCTTSILKAIRDSFMNEYDVLNIINTEKSMQE